MFGVKCAPPPLPFNTCSKETGSCLCALCQGQANTQSPPSDATSPTAPLDTSTAPDGSGASATSGAPISPLSTINPRLIRKHPFNTTLQQPEHSNMQVRSLSSTRPLTALYSTQACISDIGQDKPPFDKGDSLQQNLPTREKLSSFSERNCDELKAMKTMRNGNTRKVDMLLKTISPAKTVKETPFKKEVDDENCLARPWLAGRSLLSQTSVERRRSA